MSARNLASTRPTGLPTSTPPVPTSPWVRNPSWIALPSITSSDEKLIALHAVYPSGNLVAFTVAGDYTVDWGDGTVQNFTGGTTAQREYSYSAAALVGTEAVVTLDAAASEVQRVAHGYTNGMSVQLWNVTGTSGLVAAQTYFVVNAAANAFQLAATRGGAAISFAGAGTASLLPYRQTIITITPQGGASLTSINLQVRHSAAASTTYTAGYLDLAVAGPSITALAIGAANAGVVSVAVAMLERARILRVGAAGTGLDSMLRATNNLRVAEVRGIGGATSLTSLFLNCFSLTEVTISDTQSVQSMQNMFTGCTALVSAPMFDASAATNVSSMFSECRSLRYVPPYNLASATNLTSMFNNCAALTAAPLLNTPSATNMTDMFSGCASLVVVPLLNTSAVTTMFRMFQNCLALKTVPLFNTQSVTSMSLMFTGCSSLVTIPAFNTALVTNMSSMFSTCQSLVSVPALNTAAVTDMSSMFTSCTLLTVVPAFNTASVINMSSMFSTCRTLTSVPAFNTAAVTNMSGMFSNCAALTSVPFFNTASVTNMSSMFSGCTALTAVPAFNTAAVTNAFNMFGNCRALTYVPTFNTASVTSMSSMFNGCTSLAAIPALNGNAVPNSASFNTIFANCQNLSRSEVTGFRWSHSYANCKLSATELDAIYTRLPTVTAQTITVTGNYGTAGDNPSIATAKGWTVTG